MNILLICDYHKDVAQNMLDHIKSFHKYSENLVTQLSIFGKIPNSVNLNSFDVIIIHYSVYILDSDFLSQSCIERIKSFKGIKCIFVQDEYRNVNKLIEKLNYIEVDFLYSCMNKMTSRKVYKSLNDKTKIIETLPSYISEELLNKNLELPKINKRKIDIFYRSREIWECGSFGYEKQQIFKYFKKNVPKEFIIDIDTDEFKRIYGEKYLKKIMNSKTILGTESGSSLIDYNSEIKNNLLSFREEFPNKTFYEFEKEFLKKIDNKTTIKVISPRCFEAAALKTTMILFKGNYSGILLPNIHYIPLEKDFSNFSEIIKKLKDHKYLQKIADQAFKDIAKNPKYHFKKFIQDFDATLKSVNKKKIFKKRSPEFNTFEFINYKNRFRRKISYFFLKRNSFFFNSIKSAIKSSILLVSKIKNYLFGIFFHLFFKIFKIKYIDNFYEPTSVLIYKKLFLNSLIPYFLINIFRFKKKKSIKPYLNSQSKKRSILFFGHCYYNFLYLSKALKKRGWDSLNCSIDYPNDKNAKFNHGSELNLYDPDSKILSKNIIDFFSHIAGRFNMIHFYGYGVNSLFQEISIQTNLHEFFYPLDLIYLKTKGIKIGYTTSGCNDGTSQSSLMTVNRICNKCVLQKDHMVCSDKRNLNWGDKRDRIIDLFATESNYSLDFQSTNNCFREPLTQALDKEVFKNKDYFYKKGNPIKIFHSVGNLQFRTHKKENVKGSFIILQSINRLIKEGYDIELIHFDKNIPNKKYIKFMNNSHLVVDQINYGRYGSTTREALMLNKPVVCNLSKSEPNNFRTLESFSSIPIISCNENNFYKILKNTIESIYSGKINEKIKNNVYRDYALKWFSADSCAERFEIVYDKLQEGKFPREIEKEMFNK